MGTDAAGSRFKRWNGRTGKLYPSADDYFTLYAVGCILDSENRLVGRCEPDANGFIIAGRDLVRDRCRTWSFAHDPFVLETSVPCIVAAGDVRSSSVKRAASSASTGSIAIQFVHRYLATLGAGPALEGNALVRTL